MITRPLIDELASQRVQDSNGFDFDAALNFAGYEPAVENNGNMTYQHETGSTATVLFDKESRRYATITATTPVGGNITTESAHQVATMAFTGATPLGVVLAALLSPQWQTMCADAATDADQRRLARISQLRQELALLEQSDDSGLSPAGG